MNRTHHIRKRTVGTVKIKIIEHIARHGVPATMEELATALETSKSVVYYYIKKLRASGWINDETKIARAILPKRYSAALKQMALKELKEGEK